MDVWLLKQWSLHNSTSKYGCLVNKIGARRVIVRVTSLGMLKIDRKWFLYVL